MELLSKYGREYKVIEKYVANGYEPETLGYTINVPEFHHILFCANCQD